MVNSKKTFYRLIVWIRLLVSLHVGYQYVTYSSSERVSDEKKWTFVEAITDEVWYLPYVSASDSDKFYQSLLFRWCVLPVLNEATIEYKDDLCTISTNDYKKFTIRLSDQVHTWSDKTTVNLNDILFTYKTIIAENYWNLNSLTWLWGVVVSPDSESNQITVDFPQPSIDNMIFFTNFILPSHILANQPIESYIEVFWSQPITSWCATLQPSITDPTSTVFDLESCENTNLRYYQVKAFTSSKNIEEYIPTGSLTIDMSTQDINYEWYTNHQVLINKIQTFFFNTQSENFTVIKRKTIGDLFSSLFAISDTQDYLIKDPYLFDQYSTKILNNTGAIAKIREILQWSTQPTQALPSLTSTLLLNETTRTQDFQLQETIVDKFQITLLFDKAFDRISISHNGGAAYTPASYSSLNKSSFYNLNPLFRNITAWQNTYGVIWYSEDWSTSSYEFSVSYLSSNNENVQPSTSTTQPLRIISFEDKTSSQLIKDLQQLLMVQWLSEFFEFQSYDERNEYEWKLTSRDYDIVLRTINLWLRKDISRLFTQDDPLINPSLWSDNEFADQMNRYFRTEDIVEKQAIKWFIDERFSEQYPLAVIWKSIETITLRDDIENPFPFRLYVLGWRGQYLPNIEIFNHISVDRDRIKSVDNFITFLGDSVTWTLPQKNSERIEE